MSHSIYGGLITTACARIGTHFFVDHGTGTVVGFPVARQCAKDRSRQTGTVAGLLFLLAHPDDETFIAGGTIAKYAAATFPGCAK
jgi:hypothetical protein